MTGQRIAFNVFKICLLGVFILTLVNMTNVWRAVVDLDRRVEMLNVKLTAMEKSIGRESVR